MNSFLDAIRVGGLKDPPQIVLYAIRILQSRLQSRGRYADDPRTNELRQAILIVQGHPREALALAREALAYERLSPEAKARRKAARAEQGRQAWKASQPPSEKQVAYLKSLGATELPTNRLDASRLIDSLLQKGRRHG